MKDSRFILFPLSFHLHPQKIKEMQENPYKALSIQKDYESKRHLKKLLSGFFFFKKQWDCMYWKKHCQKLGKKNTPHFSFFILTLSVRFFTLRIISLFPLLTFGFCCLAFLSFTVLLVCHINYFRLHKRR